VPALGERHDTRRPLEERRSELLLELANARSKRGGGQHDLARSFSEVEQARSFDEAPQ
jgi:hypothetical protein